MEYDLGKISNEISKRNKDENAVCNASEYPAGYGEIFGGRLDIETLYGH